MRAYRSCASGRCGWRSSPVRATRWAVSSCPLWRNSSPSRRKTRLSGSCASWEDRVLISSGMRPRPGERLGRRLGAAHLFELRQLRLRAWSEPFPRSEEHTSELQSQPNLVSRLLLDKKKISRTETPGVAQCAREELQPRCLTTPA